MTKDIVRFDVLDIGKEEDVPFHMVHVRIKYNGEELAKSPVWLKSDDTYELVLDREMTDDHETSG